MKKKLACTLILPFCLLISSAYAQAKLDSLWSVWHDERQADTSRLDAMHKIAFTVYRSMPDSILHFAQMEYDFAQEKNLTQYMAKAINIQGVAYKDKGIFDSARVYYLRAWEIQKEIGLIDGHLWPLSNLGTLYSNQKRIVKSDEYFNLALQLTRELGSKIGEGQILHNLGISYNKQGKKGQALTYYKQALEVRQEIDDKPGLAWTHTNMGTIYQQLAEWDESLESFNQAYRLRELLGDKDEMADILNRIGVTYNRQGNRLKAIEYFEKSLSVYREIGQKTGIGGALINLAGQYHYLGDILTSIEYLQEGAKICEEIGNKRYLANALVGLAKLYQAINDTISRNQYFLKEIKLRKELGNNWQAYVSTGYYYANNFMYEKATIHFKQALKLSEETKVPLEMVTCLMGLGLSYKGTSEYEKSLDFYLRAAEVCQAKEIKQLLAESLANVGDVYQLQKRYRKAIPIAHEALELAQEQSSLDQIRDASLVLYHCYKATGQYRLALEMSEVYVHMRDSMSSEANQRTIIQQEYRSAYEKKALADSLLADQEKVQLEFENRQRIQRATSNRNMILGGTSLLLILAVALWSRLRFTRRTNKSLSEKNEIIAQEKNRAEHSEAAKEQFLANMSHEIRTPMHAISGMVKILERNKHYNAQEVLLDAMHKSSDNLIVLLNDILDLSKIEAGKLNVESIPMQPTAVIENVNQILKYKAEEKGLRLLIDISPEIPSWVMGDPTRLNQILINLAGNALKFTEKGSVSIAISKKKDFLIYEIRDTGIGISDDKLQSIFDAFEQAEGSTARRFGGTGLGLNISRQLVELQGGNIWAESEPGKGSSFFVSLPLVAVGEEIASQQRLSEGEFMEMTAALRGKRILMAEDNEFNQMIAQDDLEYYIEDIHVDIAENGLLAVKKAQSGLYDLILMDVQMPEMDGVEATLKIREWEQVHGKVPLPIIAMSASVLKSEINLCLEAGMNNYIPKPYQAEELIGTIYAEIPQTDH